MYKENGLHNLVKKKRQKQRCEAVQEYIFTSLFAEKLQNVEKMVNVITKTFIFSESVCDKVAFLRLKSKTQY
jgi:hypothetical protein